MMRTWLLLLGLTAAVPAAADVDTRFLQGLGDVRLERLDSEVVGRSYHLYVMLPDAYDASPELSYPTLYVLDGGALFPLLAAYYRYLRFAGEIPDLIIVGISYGTDSFEQGNFRSTDYTAPAPDRDYWGGAGRFQSVLAEELLPLVENRYRARSDRRIVFGQSIGGQFVLYTALTRPALFWGHVASNPALHRNLPFFLAAHFDGETPAADARRFVASAEFDDPGFRKPARQWIAHWSRQRELPWRLETAVLEGHSHMSAPPAAFRDGLRWLFGAARAETGSGR